MTTILVTGSRKLPKALEPLVRRHLAGAMPVNPLVAPMLIHGGAGGVDAFAARWAYDSGIEAHSYPAKWREHVAPWCRCKCALIDMKAICKGAGRRRNQQMLDDANPTRVLAFPAPDSVGTWDMIRRAVAAGLLVSIVPLRP